MKLTAHTAREILDSCEIDQREDSHVLRSDQHAYVKRVQKGYDPHASFRQD